MAQGQRDSAAFASWGSVHLLAEKNRMLYTRFSKPSAKIPPRERSNERDRRLLRDLYRETKIGGRHKPVAAASPRRKIKEMRGLQAEIARFSQAGHPRSSVRCDSRLQNSTCHRQRRQGGLSLPTATRHKKRALEKIRDEFAKRARISRCSATSGTADANAKHNAIPTNCSFERPVEVRDQKRNTTDDRPRS